MPNPPPPSNPNFTPPVGRLATDRYDFQTHIEGLSFRHQATQIDLFPTVVVGGNTVTTVQSAIAALAAITSPPVIPQATVSQLGVIQLNGDIGGSATSVRVTGLQGRPVSSAAPTTGSVLAWTGVAWAPNSANVFVANGDLVGTSTFQEVVNLTGNSGTVTVSCNTISFLSGITANLTQNSTAFAGGNFSIAAQNSNILNGGNVVISGGNAGSSPSALRGGVQLKIANSISSSIPIQAMEVATNQRVVALAHPSTVTSTDMPAGTGDLVMYVRDAAVTPSSGSPSNGTLVYSTGGQLWIKQSNGVNFPVGSIPNPSVWGSSGQQTYTYRTQVTSTVSTPINISVPNFASPDTIPDMTAMKVDVIMVGKEVGTADSAQFNLSIGFVRHGGSPVTVGALNISDPRTTAAASAWNLPTITASGNNLLVTTGSSSSANVNWMVVIQLTTSTSS